MKLSLLATLILVSSAAQASDVVLKSLRCENGALKATVQVSQSPGSAALVEWTVTSKSTGETTKAAGYLFANDGLDNFSSSDVFDSMEVDGQVLTLSTDGQDEVLSCR